MYGFSGWHDHTLDEKGRVALPASFRDKLGTARDSRVFATRSLSGPCIELYPESEWQRLLEKVAAMSQANPKVIAFRRRFISSAFELSLDRSGRVLIPQSLRTACSLQKEVLVAGNIERIEIWDRDTFRALNDDLDGQELLEGMADLGL